MTIHERDNEMPTTTAVAFSINNSQPLSRRTRSVKFDNQFGASGSVDGGSSFDGHDDDSALEMHDGAASDSLASSARANGVDGPLKDTKSSSRQIPAWLSYATPNEFLEVMKKSDAPLHVKYLETLVECLCVLGKVAAAGAILWSRIGHSAKTSSPGLNGSKGLLESYQVLKQKRQNGASLTGALLAVSPVSLLMAPMGSAQVAACELLNVVFDNIVRILELPVIEIAIAMLSENHVIVGELLESKSTQQSEVSTPKLINGDMNLNSDPEASQATGGYSVGFCLSVVQSEFQQLICEIMRATPEAASADASTQTARLAGKVPTKDKRDGSEEGLSFTFRFAEAAASIPNQGMSQTKSANIIMDVIGNKSADIAHTVITIGKDRGD
ncbi:hypothetical protein ACLOJK_029779 [Asimina triloba]